MPSATPEMVSPIDDAAGQVGPSPGKRLDIQGLRAIAVTLVVIDHLTGWPGGGFIGVDVFFVLSGFLITGILLREGDETGRLSIANFYRRRIRRILPASWLALAVTVTASYLIVVQDRFERIVTDAWWSLIFLANWHLSDVGTDYFQSALPPSPLQHYWSLAVEEQFYVVWPVLLTMVLLVARPVRRRGREVPTTRVVGVLALAVVIGSFAWAMHQSTTEPTVAYFSTFTRAWELAAGALLAVCAARVAAIGSVTRNVLAVLGLVGIVASMFLIDPQSTFPAPVGAVPVLGTVLVLASGIGREASATRPLRFAPVVYIGTISYSVYLWHWPIIVLLETQRGGKDTTYYVLAVLLTVVASMLSYHLVEAPVLNSGFLVPATRRRDRWHGGSRFLPAGTDAQYIGLAGIAIVAVLLSIVALAPKDPPALDSALEQRLTDQQVAAAQQQAAATGEDWLTTALTKALDSTEFPNDLAPALGRTEDAKAPQMDDRSCINDPDLSATTDPPCTYGDGDRLAVVVGDSVAISWMPGVIKALEPQGYRVHGVAFADCPYADVRITLDNPDEQQACEYNRAALYRHVRDLHPDLVIFTESEGITARLADQPGDPGAIQELAGGVSRAIISAAAPGTRAVVLAPPPSGLSPSECASRSAVPADCQSSIANEWQLLSTAEKKGAETSGAQYVDTRSWFCVDTACPIYALGTTVRWDTVHLTSNYAQLLAPKLKRALLNSGT